MSLSASFHTIILSSFDILYLFPFPYVLFDFSLVRRIVLIFSMVLPTSHLLLSLTCNVEYSCIVGMYFKGRHFLYAAINE